MPDVSVIIPVYNSNRYLKECLDSIVNQTLSNIEIICVDDGSTDGSLDILHEYAAKDNRFVVLEQKNSGAGVARNLGMSIARGRYLSFLDSDDFFSLTLFEETVLRADTTNADIVVYRFVKFNQKNKEYISCDYAFHSEYWKPEVFSFRDNPKKYLIVSILRHGISCLKDNLFRIINYFFKIIKELMIFILQIQL